MNILVTGGAGFIGSHLCDELIQHGHTVRVIDSLEGQVHGAEMRRPPYLNPKVQLFRGSLEVRLDVDCALEGADVVFHLAAAVGVGQSMYDLSGYTLKNNLGTAVLLEALRQSSVRKLIVASSMSVYGEGAVTDGRPIGTDESRPPNPQSIYALTKYDQERMCLIAGKAYSIPTTALRFFNVYGPRQALSNPYTGVMAIFASQILNGKPPTVFEDGQQLRDFVHVSDVAHACRLAMHGYASDEAVNVGTGEAISILSVAKLLSRELGGKQPIITGHTRSGDIRHCYADIGKARSMLGYEPSVSFSAGVKSLAAAWADERPADHSDRAMAELSQRQLIRRR